MRSPLVAVPTAPAGSRGVALAFGYMAYSFAVAGLAACAFALAGPITAEAFVAAFVVGIGLLVALGAGWDAFRLGTLDALLTAFAVSDGLVGAFVAQRAGVVLLGVAAVAAGAGFAAMAVWGHRTRRDLSGWGPLLFLALLALLVTSLAVLSIGASATVLPLSGASVLLFCAYTAFDVQTIRIESARCTTEDDLSRVALMGSIALYLDLANLVVDCANLLQRVGSDAAQASWDVVGAMVEVAVDVVGGVLGFCADLLFGW
jgi:FtsH-binding integral membrane protein